ncbi:hypothetical protein [Paraburkholderia sp. CI3]|uniref:hypothetical protein n=1 Tax=Paraburkholderia sp. CI3 TaxID=2991060 RepID=UPI003D20000C
MNASQAITNIPHQLAGNLLDLAGQHILAVGFVAVLIGCKIYYDFVLVPRKNRERRERNRA